MRYVPALILDAVLVLVFAVIGRASHEEDPGGFLITAWPFLVALLLGHAVAALLPARPRRPWSLSWGAVVWAVTVVGGMLLRVVSGDTAQVAFIIVATLVLAVFLLGWRALAAFLRRRAGRASTDPSDDPADAEVGPAADAEPAVEPAPAVDPALESESGSAPESEPGAAAESESEPGAAEDSALHDDEDHRSR